MTGDSCDIDLTGPWTERVAYAADGGWYAYRPHCVYYPYATEAEVLDYHDVTTLQGDHHTMTRLEPLGSGRPGPQGQQEWCVHQDGLDVVAHCRELARRNVKSEPDFVFFGHPADGPSPHPSELSGNPLYGNPLYGNPLYGNPLYGNPLYGNPLYGNGTFASEVWARPVWGTPVYQSPVYADRFHAPGYRESGRRTTGARPSAGDTLLGRPHQGPWLEPRFIVLDTSLAAPGWLPPLLGPYAGSDDDDIPDWDDNGVLDPVAGHGTFIAGILARLAPDCRIESPRVLSSFGDGDVCSLRKIVADLEIDEYTIVTMSFGGYADHEMMHLARIVEHIQCHHGVVVASAGNDGIGRPSYPAALPGVVGVGGLDNRGPAAFTNYGPWLRACAPAVDLTSSFFVDEHHTLKDPQTPLPGSPDEPVWFEGWARWTGTSFAGPIVAAAIAREMLRAGCTAEEAVTTVLDGPDLMRIPNLGTVVNLSPPLPPRTRAGSARPG